MVAACLYGKIVVIQKNKVSLLMDIPDPPDVIRKIALSPDGKKLAVLVDDKGRSIYVVPLPRNIP